MNKRNSRDERLIRHGLSFIQIPERENNPTNDKNSVIFSLKNQVGGLARALQVFQVRFIFSVFNMPTLKNYVILSLNFFRNYLNLTERAKSDNKKMYDAAKFSKKFSLPHANKNDHLSGDTAVTRTYYQTYCQLSSSSLINMR